MDMQSLVNILLSVGLSLCAFGCYLNSQSISRIIKMLETEREKK